MTLVADPEVLPDHLPAFDPDPDRDHPAARWARRHIKPLLICGTAAIVVLAGLLINELTKPAPAAPSAAAPTITVRVGGDIAATTGSVRYDTGGTTQLPEGRTAAAAYVATSPAGARAVAVSVAVTADKGEAMCSIAVDGSLPVLKTAQPGELVLCFWVTDAGDAPPPFRTQR